MDLEFTVNRLVAWAHVVEIMLHGDGLWTFRTLTGITPAHRLIDREQSEIVFVGRISPAPGELVELWHGDDLITIREIGLSGDTRLTWRIRPHNLIHI